MLTVREQVEALWQAGGTKQTRGTPKGGALAAGAPPAQGACLLKRRILDSATGINRERVQAGETADVLLGLVTRGHIRPMPAKPWFVLRVQGKVVSLEGSAEGEMPLGGRRGAIKEWSTHSRARLWKTCLAVSWSDVGPLLMVTLTYPGGGQWVPVDGQVAWKHLQAFRKRWEREYGQALCLWKQEFQARGALHWMLFVQAPAVDVVDVRTWVSEAWYEIVGSQEKNHLLAGTTVLMWQGDPTGYALKYLRKQGEKEYQHVVPAGYQHLGRWWGTWGQMPMLPEKVVELPEKAFYQVRRMLVHKVQSEGRTYRIHRRGAGISLVARSEEFGQRVAAVTLDKLARSQ